MRFPHLAHRSAAAHKLHNTTATTQYEFDSGIGETFSRLPALAYSSPESVQTTGTVAPIRLIPLSQVDQYLGLAGGIRNGAAFDFFGRS